MAVPDFDCFLGQTSPARPVYALEWSRGWGTRSWSREEDKTQASVPSAGVIVREGRWTEHNPLGWNRTMEPQLNMSSVCQVPLQPGLGGSGGGSTFKVCQLPGPGRRVWKSTSYYY